MTALPLPQLVADGSSSVEEGKGRGWVRALVVAVFAASGFLVSGLPRSLNGTGIVFVVGLAVLDLVLVGSTRGLAFARARSLDERQIAVRNLAYRRGFRLLGPALVLAFAISLIGSAIANVTAVPGLLPFPQVDGGFSGRLIVGLLELLVMMPTLVIAWMEPGTAAWHWAGLGVPAMAGSAIVLVWLLNVTLAPVQQAAPGGTTFVGFSMPGAVCHHFVGGRIIGAGLGATVGTHVEVCWDGRRAFVVGTSAGPGSAQLQTPPMGDPNLTACGADTWGDFAVVSGVTCSGRISADGTLHYRFHARVSPLPFEIGAREVSMNLVVTRQGRVLQAL